MGTLRTTDSDARQRDRSDLNAIPLASRYSRPGTDQPSWDPRLTDERRGPPRRLRWHTMLVAARLPHGGRALSRPAPPDGETTPR